MSLIEPRSMCVNGVENCGLPIFEVDREPERLEKLGIIEYRVRLFYCGRCITQMREKIVEACFDEVCRRLGP